MKLALILVLVYVPACDLVLSLDPPPPVPPPPPHWVTVTAGASHTCAIQDTGARRRLAERRARQQARVRDEGGRVAVVLGP